MRARSGNVAVLSLENLEKSGSPVKGIVRTLELPTTLIAFVYSFLYIQISRECNFSCWNVKQIHHTSINPRANLVPVNSDYAELMFNV